MLPLGRRIRAVTNRHVDAADIDHVLDMMSDVINGVNS
jgi:hypothetical protein